MSRRRAGRALAAASAAALTLCLAADAWSLSGRLEGRIIDGSHGGDGTAEYVRLVRLVAGMESVGLIENVTGAFQLGDFEGEPGERFLAQASRGGVNYNESFQLSESGVNTVEISVFDTTSSWRDARILRYQIGLAAETEMLRVFKVVEVEVGGTPPRTIYDPGGTFRFYTQPDLLQMGTVNARSGTLPLTVEPIALPGGREFAVDYPLRPGVTEFQIQYDVTYDEAATVFSEALLYPVAEMNVLIVPKTIEVGSELLSDRGVEEENGIRLFSARDLPESAPVVLRLSGRGAEPSASESPEGAAPGKVVKVPNRTNEILLPTVIGVFCTLLLGAGFALTRRASGGGASGRRSADPRLLARKEAILERIVALDRKHRAGAISEYAYWQKREALKGPLVEIIEEIERGERASG